MTTSHLEDKSADICVVCSKAGGGSVSGGGRILRKTRLAKLNETAKQLHDDRLKEELTSSGDHIVPDKCYKSYTAANNISRTQKINVATGGRESPVPALCSEKKPFDYQPHCLICTEELACECVRRHPERHFRICNAEMESEEKKNIIQDSLIKGYEKGQDTIAVNVKARILFAGDIHTIEAKYHHRCLQMFISQKNIIHSGKDVEMNVRNLNSLNDDAFHHLCAWLTTSEQRHSQHTMSDLRAQLSTYLPEGVSVYNTRHIRRRLIGHFDKQVTITETEGRLTVVTLKETATSILHQSYFESDLDTDEDEEHIRLAK